MSRLRIALLNASHNDTNTRQNFQRELDADLVEFDVTAGDLPATFAFDGVVVTGSRSSVYWDEEWIRATKEWVADAADRGLPVLGICFGHQLLADALGGRVEPMGEYEIGYREVDRVGDSPLLADVPDRFTVFVTHQDSVVDLPAGAEPIAENEYGNHGFRLGHIFGIQSHPEYDAETAEAVTRGKDLGDDRLRAVLDGITEENVDRACESKTVFGNFSEYVRDVRGVSEAKASD